MNEAKTHSSKNTAEWSVKKAFFSQCCSLFLLENADTKKKVRFSFNFSSIFRNFQDFLGISRNFQYNNFLKLRRLFQIFTTNFLIRYLS